MGMRVTVPWPVGGGILKISPNPIYSRASSSVRTVNGGQAVPATLADVPGSRSGTRKVERGSEPPEVVSIAVPYDGIQHALPERLGTALAICAAGLTEVPPAE